MAVRSAAIALTAGIAIASPWPQSGMDAQDSPLLSAMQDEIHRSISQLRIKDEPAPYFIEYELDDLESMRAVARLGGVVDDLRERTRTLHVDVRVGDYAFDSSRFVTQDRGASSDVAIPIDDNYDAIRRRIWLATDAAYKGAVSVFARKKAAFQNRTVTDVLPDFSRETPIETVEPVAAPTPSGKLWVDRVKQISKAFASTPELDTEVLLSDVHGAMFYVNSEGFKSVTPVGSAYLQVYAEAPADDGSMVRDLFSITETRLEDLPPVSELVSRAAALAKRVETRRTAPVGEEFTGPILFEGQASAELVRQTLAPLMLARRAPDADNPRIAQGQATPFLTRIGLRVLSDSLSASDTPSLKQFEGRPVAGAYIVDDEGVRAQDVTLAENGRLVTLLTSRTPQKNLPRSNGHGRAGSVQAGVFQLLSSQAIPAAQLKGKYLELLKAQEKPFGYIVRSIAGPGEIAGGGLVILDIVKVTPDGVEQPVRGVRLNGAPSTSFRDILEASAERTLLNYRINAATTASVIAPNLIFEELEIQKAPEIIQKPPIVPAPLP